jgi:hypothetical protein
MQPNEVKNTTDYGWISKEELAIKMEGIDFKLSQL